MDVGLILPYRQCVQVVNIKFEFNMSYNCYNQYLLFLKELLREDQNNLMITIGLNKWLQNLA